MSSKSPPPHLLPDWEPSSLPSHIRHGSDDGLANRLIKSGSSLDPPSLGFRDESPLSACSDEDECSRSQGDMPARRRSVTISLMPTERVNREAVIASAHSSRVHAVESPRLHGNAPQIISREASMSSWQPPESWKSFVLEADDISLKQPSSKPSTPPTTDIVKSTGTSKPKPRLPATIAHVSDDELSKHPSAHPRPSGAATPESRRSASVSKSPCALSRANTASHPVSEPDLLSEKKGQSVHADDSDADHRLLGSTVCPASPSMTSNREQRRVEKLFPEYCKTEVVNSFSCALEKDVLWQGKMYITGSHVLFHGNIFARTVDIVLPFEEIISIEKKSTVVMFPNAIRICTTSKKCVFSSFLKRDSAYHCLVNAWCRLTRKPHLLESNDDEAPSASRDEDDNRRSEVSTTMASFRGESLSAAWSETPDQQHRLSLSNSRAPSKIDVDVVLNSQRLASIAPGPAPNTPQLLTTGLTPTATLQSRKPSSSSIGPPVPLEPLSKGPGLAVPIPGADPVSSEDTDEIPSWRKYKYKILDEVIEMDPPAIFELLFGSNGSDVIRATHAKRKTADVHFEPWEQVADGQGQRRLVTYCPTYKTTMTQKKIAQCTESQTVVSMEKGYFVDCVIKTPNVPYGSDFETHNLYSIEPAEVGKSRLIVTASAVFHRKLIWKDRIEVGSIESSEHFAKELCKQIRKYLRRKNQVPDPASMAAVGGGSVQTPTLLSVSPSTLASASQTKAGADSAVSVGSVLTVIQGWLWFLCWTMWKQLYEQLLVLVVGSPSLSESNGAATSPERLGESSEPESLEHLESEGTTKRRRRSLKWRSVGKPSHRTIGKMHVSMAEMTRHSLETIPGSFSSFMRASGRNSSTASLGSRSLLALDGHPGPRSRPRLTLVILAVFAITLALAVFNLYSIVALRGQVNALFDDLKSREPGIAARSGDASASAEPSLPTPPVDFRPNQTDYIDGQRRIYLRLTRRLDQKIFSMKRRLLDLNRAVAKLGPHARHFEWELSEALEHYRHPTRHEDGHHPDHGREDKPEPAAALYGAASTPAPSKVLSNKRRPRNSQSNRKAAGAVLVCRRPWGPTAGEEERWA
ncbi:uncharacterized protein BJ171DRAFT_480642 [Polychytrium aggregatum]|uniref:uncharacterized protein n=1 Tax=Polychytrium aggregatum TaxID=110093 RepID=UPI0022FED251|nr:uncharacterized protein BJ171DRAFT_480642 [Polychytrium aggregatum]KAI9193119.1 hypothetical protein BJ171DRAFT_480642 [Polychytrium aggregatum]